MSSTLLILVGAWLTSWLLCKFEMRYKKPETAGQAAGKFILGLVSPITAPYFIGMRMLHRMDRKRASIWAKKPEPIAPSSFNNEKEKTEFKYRLTGWELMRNVCSLKNYEYRSRKIRSTENDANVVIGAYFVGLFWIGLGVTAILFGIEMGPDNLGEIVRNVGEILVNIGRK